MSMLEKSILKPLADFFSWWLQELLTLLPSKLQSFLSKQEGNKTRIILSPTSSKIENYSKGKLTQTKSIEHAILKSNTPLPTEFNEVIQSSLPHIEVQLCSSMIFKNTIELPPAVSGKVDSAIELQMDKLCPLPAESYHYLYNENQSPDSGQIHVSIFFVKNDILTPWVILLKKNNKDFIITHQDQQANNKQTHFYSQITSSKLKKVNKYLFFLFPLILVVSFYADIFLQTSLVDDLQTKVEKLKIEAESVQQVRLAVMKKLDAQLAYQDKVGYFSVLDIVNELTKQLPDNTWVTELAINGNSVLIKGLSQDATKLPALIEQSIVFDQTSLNKTEKIRSQDKFELSTNISTGQTKK